MTMINAFFFILSQTSLADERSRDAPRNKLRGMHSSLGA
jgi:hypothetical protein